MMIAYEALMVSVLMACVSDPHAAQKVQAAHAVSNHSTCALAVPVKGESHSQGVSYQFSWLKEHYPGYDIVDQAPLNCPRGHATSFKLTQANHPNVVVVFDLSGVWGKGLKWSDSQP